MDNTTTCRKIDVMMLDMQFKLTTYKRMDDMVNTM